MPSLNNYNNKQPMKLNHILLINQKSNDYHLNLNYGKSFFQNTSNILNFKTIRRLKKIILKIFLKKLKSYLAMNIKIYKRIHDIAISLYYYIIYREVILRKAVNDGNQTVILFYRDIQLMERFGGKYYTEFGQIQLYGYKNKEKVLDKFKFMIFQKDQQIELKAVIDFNIYFIQNLLYLLMNQRYCPFCLKIQSASNVKHIYSQLINSGLYTKYSQRKSKNFEDFFARKPVKWVIDFKDDLHLQDDDEYLKRFYLSNQQPHKFKSLLQYYRFHQNLPRLFFGVLAEKALLFFEKKKKYEYRRIKKMLGIPYDESNQSTQYEKLNEDIKVLNSLSKFTEKSTKSILNEFFKIQPNEQQLNIDETWLTMQQYELNTPQKVPQNLKVIRKLVQNQSKDKINPPFHLLKGKTLSNIRNTQNQSPERLNPPQKSSSQQYIISNQEECEFQQYMKQKISALSQQNKIKINKIFQNRNQIDQNYYINNIQGKRNSTHFITSTSNGSPDQIKIEQSRFSQMFMNLQDRQSQSNLFNHVFPTQQSSQLIQKTDVSPNKKNQKIIQIYSNNLSNKIKTQPRKSPEKQRIFQHTQSQSIKFNNQKTLTQNISPVLQFKFRLDDLQHSNNKRKLQNSNSDQYQLQIEDKQQLRGQQSYSMIKNKIQAKLQIKNK